MIATALILSIVLAASSLGLAYSLGGLWWAASGVVILGLLSILGRRPGWSWTVGLTSAVFVVVAAVGAVLNLSILLLVVGLTAALSAWELDGLARELASVDAVKRERALKRGHLQRLLFVDGLCLVLAAVAATVELRLSFAVALLVALVALVGLSRALRFLRRQGE